MRRAGYSQYIDAACNFSRRAGTPTRAPVPRGMYEECKLSFLSDIDKCIRKHKIPPELVLNADQTPSSYVSVGRMTMAEKNSQSVPIKGLKDKRNITLTFVTSLAGEFLSMQVIYQGKTKASLRIQPALIAPGLETLYFPRDFVLLKTQNTTPTKRKKINSELIPSSTHIWCRHASNTYLGCF